MDAIGSVHAPAGERVNPPPTPQPERLCILRLSAIGDITHVVPIVRSIQRQWPDTRIAWVIGKIEAQLVGDLPGVEFIVVDKRRGWRAYFDLRHRLARRRFDVLLHMQVALRANLLAGLVPADVRLGYDYRRSRDCHGMFINKRIPEQNGQHVLDLFFSFIETLGLQRDALTWDLPIPEEAKAFAIEHIPGGARALIISPCSSHQYRDWRADYYAAVADHAIEHHGLRVLLCGGPSRRERDMGTAITASMRHEPINLIGRDTLKRLLALLERADVLVAPDSGPMHMATCVGTPVIGLHAASNPRRSGPYLSLVHCVDRYDDAARQRFGRPASELPWGTKLEYPGVMELIQPTDVISKLDALVGTRRA